VRCHQPWNYCCRPVTSGEEQPIGAVVCLARSSPVADEVVRDDDVIGDDTAAVARAAGASVIHRCRYSDTKTGEENR
jgi:hypothetical protein